MPQSIDSFIAEQLAIIHAPFFEADVYSDWDIHNNLKEQLSGIVHSVQDIEKVGYPHAEAHFLMHALYLNPDSSQSMKLAYNYHWYAQTGTIALGKVIATMGGIKMEYIPVREGDTLTIKHPDEMFRELVKDRTEQLIREQLQFLSASGLSLTDINQYLRPHYLEDQIEAYVHHFFEGRLLFEPNIPYAISLQPDHAGEPSFLFVYEWNPYNQAIAMQQIDVSIHQSDLKGYTVLVEGNPQFVKELQEQVFLQSMQYQAAKELDLQPNYTYAIDRLSNVLTLHGFFDNMSEKKHQQAQQEMKRQLHTIMNDASIENSKFISIPLLRRFDDGTEVKFHFNILCNRPAELIKIHSIRAQTKDTEQLFMPHQENIYPATIMKDILQHEQRMAKAKSLLEHTRPEKALSLR